jgi:hypothetical protein
VPQELKVRFAELVAVTPEADRELVFGGPAALVGGNMCFGAHAAGVFVKLPPEQAQELLAVGGEPFEPMPGRAMGGFVVLPDGDLPDRVRKSYEYTKTLPPSGQLIGDRRPVHRDGRGGLDTARQPVSELLRHRAEQSIAVPPRTADDEEHHLPLVALRRVFGLKRLLDQAVRNAIMPR